MKIAIVTLTLLSGCGKDIECGLGTGLSDGKCVPLAAKDPIDESLGQLEGFAKQMCECKDRQCADPINAAMTAWGERVSKGSSRGIPSSSQQQRMEQVTKKYIECMKAVFGN